jgi:hypothetical protein
VFETKQDSLCHIYEAPSGRNPQPGLVPGHVTAFVSFVVLCLAVVSSIAGCSSLENSNKTTATPADTSPYTTAPTIPDSATITRTTTNAITVTPTALTPGHSSGPGDVITTLTPTLQWTGVEAEYYTVYIWQEVNNPWGVIYTSPPLFENTFMVPVGVLEEGGQYFWNLSAYYSNAPNSASNTLYFQTPSVQLQAPL